MDYKEKHRAVRKLHAYVREWRGDILNHVAVIEKDIAAIISHYFCKEDRRNFFYSEIATADFFTFRKKISILGRILKKDYGFFWDNHSYLTNELGKIGEFRNVLAHSTIDVSDEALSRHPKDGVGFVSFSDGQRVVKVYTEADRNDWSGRMGTVSSDIEDIIRIIGVQRH